MADATYRIGKCKWCGDKGEVYRDNGLCEECDSRTIYCAVCRERSHEDYSCRHVFKSDDCGWHGSGYDPCDNDIKRPFHRLLSAMGEEFARDLKTAIQSGKFHTWLVAPMIGGGGFLTLYGMSHDARHGYGDLLIRLGESDRADDLHDGYCWLASLHDRNTLKANQTTVNWIDQWLWPFTPSLQLSSTERDSKDQL